MRIKQIKPIINKILRPPSWVTALLILISGVLLYAVFNMKLEGTALAYTAYPISAYTLIVFIIYLPTLLKKIKDKLSKTWVVQKIYGSPLGQRFFKDMAFRNTASIYQGIAVSVLYALFRGVAAVVYGSVWFGAISVYYIILSVIRFALAGNLCAARKQETAAQRLIKEYQGYRFCGYMMFILNVGMTGMVIQMIRDNRHYEYPGFIIYASAAYTFYLAIAATVNVFKLKRLNSPLFSAAKSLTFVGALMSVMALQTAMISRFGEGEEIFRQVLNTATGTVICALALGIAVYMVVKANKEIKELRYKEEEFYG